MRVTALASGSSGNAMLVEAGATRILVDAGLQGPILSARLRQAGCPPGDLAGILLTHEHQDHVAGALALAETHHIPLIADPRTLAALFASPARRFEQPRVTEDEPIQVTIDPHPAGTSWRLGDLAIASIPIPHDAAAPCGYLLSSGAWTACVVTDCGAMTPGVLEALSRANLIVLEANHDREKLIRGPYPQHLKQRILGPTGHLANHEAAEALFAVLDGDPRWVWLAHLSRTNNTPELARAAVATRLGARRLRRVKLEIMPPGMGPCWESAAVFS